MLGSTVTAKPVTGFGAAVFPSVNTLFNAAFLDIFPPWDTLWTLKS